MENKKGQKFGEFMMVYGLVIVALVVIIFISFLAYFKFLDPITGVLNFNGFGNDKFVIYKEINVNKCIIGLRPCEYMDDCPIGYNHISYTHSCENSTENIEVEEMKFEYKKWEIVPTGILFSDITGEERTWNIIPRESNSKNYYEILVPKQDISREFLDENAECELIISTNAQNYYYKKEEFRNWDEFSRDVQENGGGLKCSEWKLNDHIIQEVN